MPTPPLGVRARWRRLRERALAGAAWHRACTLVALCVVWALSITVQDIVGAWREGSLADWLVNEAGGEFACIVVIALGMALPLSLASRFGPQAGWSRTALLVLAVAAAGVVGGALRMAFNLLDGKTFSEFPAALYLTWWMRYVQLAALFTLVVEYQRRESRSLEAMHGAEVDRLALDREMDEARLQVLQAQIEPHFLFNTLANVRRLYQTDHVAGRTMLENLMRYLEVALPHMRDARSTLRRELSLVEAYLGVQRIRMGRRLGFQLDAPIALGALDVPPMMLLTLVENAIKHGINPLPEGGFIRVVARLEGDRLRLDVADNGRGFQAASGGGTGLANIRARLAAMHGDAATLTLADNLPRGVTATLMLPTTTGADA